MKSLLSLSFTLIIILSLTALGDVDVSKLPPAATKEGVTYDKDIRPILSQSCFKCHGPNKQKSDLRLDTLDGALKGGKSGPVIVPGKSADSSLVIAIARLDKKTAMPPKGKPVSTDDIALIRAWIDQGAH